MAFKDYLLFKSVESYDWDVTALTAFVNVQVFFVTTYDVDIFLGTQSRMYRQGNQATSFIKQIVVNGL